MKRLQCLYKPEKSKDYPWALKHPKVATALALFKTRQEATDWYLSLHYDCVYWFQNEEKIWAGQIVSEKNPEGVVENEVIIDNFDGALPYEETCEEFYIDSKNWTRDIREEKNRVSKIKDFKLLKDPEKYFPAEDVIRPARKSKKDIEIEELRAQITLLLNELSKSTNDYSKEISELREQLKDNSSDKTQLLQRVLELQKAEQKAKEAKIIEKHEAELLPNLVKFAYIKNLSVRDQVEVLALYTEKVKEMNANVSINKTNNEDLQQIKTNIEEVKNHYLRLLKESSEDLETSEKIKMLLEVLKEHAISLVNQLELVKEAKSTPSTSAFYKEELTNSNISLNLGTSFVLYNMKHVAFVPEKDYKHSISVLNSIQDQRVVVLNGSFIEAPIIEKEVIVEKIVETPAKASEENKRWWTLMFSLLTIGLTAIIIVIILALVFLT